ncbi:MAG TPA: phosphatase [Actinomycetota bacterium]
MRSIEPQERAGAFDRRWTPAPHSEDDLLRGMIAGGMAGVVSHPMDNVLWKIGLLCDGDPDAQFGLSGVDVMTRQEVLALVGAESGFEPDPYVRWGPVRVQPEPILAACRAMGDRLAVACERGERVVLATGHPTGLIQLYGEVGRLLERLGCTLLFPADGFEWEEPHSRMKRRQIRYLGGVAVLTDRASASHTHSPRSMQIMLEEEQPDLVVADHGFAGAAIEAGIDTVSVADVNDPALIVAKAQRRTEVVVVMDDNVRPDAYWPCYQAIAERLPFHLLPG